MNMLFVFIKIYYLLSSIIKMFSNIYNLYFQCQKNQMTKIILAMYWTLWFWTERVCKMIKLFKINCNYIKQWTIWFSSTRVSKYSWLKQFILFLYLIKNVMNAQHKFIFLMCLLLQNINIFYKPYNLTFPQQRISIYIIIVITTIKLYLFEIMHYCMVMFRTNISFSCTYNTYNNLNYRHFHLTSYRTLIFRIFS